MADEVHLSVEAIELLYGVNYEVEKFCYVLFDRELWNAHIRDQDVLDFVKKANGWEVKYDEVLGLVAVWSVGEPDPVFSAKAITATLNKHGKTQKVVKA